MLGTLAALKLRLLVIRPLFCVALSIIHILQEIVCDFIYIVQSIRSCFADWSKNIRPSVNIRSAFFPVCCFLLYLTNRNVEL